MWGAHVSGAQDSWIKMLLLPWSAYSAAPIWYIYLQCLLRPPEYFSDAHYTPSHSNQGNACSNKFDEEERHYGK